MKTLFSLLVLASCAFAQPPDTLWTRTYDFGIQFEWVWDIKLMPEGGWVTAEETFDSLFQPYSRNFIRFTESGDTLWSRSGLLAQDIIVLSDGFLIGGVSLFRADANGDSLWRRNYLDTYHYSRVDTTAEHDIYALGQAGPSRYLIKADENGSIVWSYAITNSVARLGGVVAMPDGGCVVAFIEAQAYPSYLGHPEVFRLDNDGNLMWTYVYPDSNFYFITNPLLTQNGGIACAFSRFDAYFLHLSDTGDPLESRIICYIGGSQCTRQIISVNESGYVIVTDELLRVAPNGQFLWSQAPQIPVASDFVAFEDVAALPDGGYLLAGDYESDPTGDDFDTFILKLDQERPLLIDTMFASATDSGIQVTLSSLWEYQSQNIRFYQGISPSGPFTSIAFLPASNLLEGSDYEVWDTNIAPGESHWYYITVSDLDGRVWEYREHMVSATALSADNLPNVSRTFSLAAYPNPFNATITLTFSLPDPTDVNLDLFDVTGRRVMSLAAGRYDAGVHYQTVNGSSLASGVYLARLTTSSSTATQKLLLLK